MIEQRRLPLVAVVAGNAAGHPIRRELLPVDVLMAAFTFGRRRLEVHIGQLRLHIRWLVAIRARRRPVRPNQHKIRLSVIEPRQLFPRLRRVARLATRRLAIQARPQHPLPELPLMRIGVARRAIQVLPVIDRRHFVAGRDDFFVAIRASHGRMPTCEEESCLFVFCQRERRRPVSLEVMALLAPV